MPDIQFMVRDPQGAVYGPAPLETIRQWIREGRITATMQLAQEGGVDWMPAAAHPELQSLFAPEQVAAATGQRPAGMPPPSTPVMAPGPGAAPVGGQNPYAAPTTNYATPVQGAKTNGMAIASLVCGCLGLCCCIGGILGIIFGVIAKKQIKESNGMQTGDGLALAGIIVGAVTMLLNGCFGVLHFMATNGGGGRF